MKRIGFLIVASALLCSCQLIGGAQDRTFVEPPAGGSGGSGGTLDSGVGGGTGGVGGSGGPVMPDSSAGGSIPDASGVDGSAGADTGPSTDADVKRADGEACTADAQCDHGHCVDGVCCNAACTGSCEQCDLPNLAGTCSPVPAGVAAPAPHTACTKDAEATCKQNGLCDGNGACQLYASGTVCAAGSCDTAKNELKDAAKCDGDGTCAAARTVTCAPFKCQGAACATTCAVDGDCVGQPCVGGSCGKVVNGSACTSIAQCQSNFCVDKLCCDSACGEQCKACNVVGSEGKCTQVTSSQPHGTRPQCSGSGSTCAGACAAGNTSCTYPITQCRALGCADGVQTLAASCSAGTCPTKSTSTCTGGYGCNGTGCYTTCTDDAHCASGTPYCNGGSCQSLKPNGRTCGAAGECDSGNCVDGYCCNTSCTEPCKACNMPNSLGSCTQVTSGQPHGSRAHCAGENTSPCGGYCANGSMSCTYPNTQCRTATCSANQQTAAANCSQGGCPTAVVTPCAPYTCNVGNTACANSCATDSDCAAPSPYCNTGTGKCEATAVNGHSCPTGCAGGVPTCADSKCTSGYCADTYCCNAACNDSCQVCNAAGTCTQVTSGQPRNGRTACSGSAPCTGSCASGKTECTYPTSLCSSASCNATQQKETRASYCSGGSCPSATTANCDPYVCGANACLTSCTSDSQCQATSTKPFCVGNVCVDKAPNGHSCPAGCSNDSACGKCASGYCYDTVCCGGAIYAGGGCGTCGVCNMVGYEGGCQPKPARMACLVDPMFCDGQPCDAQYGCACHRPKLPCGPLDPPNPPYMCAEGLYCNSGEWACTDVLNDYNNQMRCAKQADCPAGEVCCYQSYPSHLGSRCDTSCAEGNSPLTRRMCVTNADCTNPSYPNCNYSPDAYNRYWYCNP